MLGDDALPENLDVAINEATWFGLSLGPGDHEIALNFDVFTLPEGVGGEGHARLTLVLRSVNRIVASLRLGRWNDVNAEVAAVSVDELPSVVVSFGGSAVYGWEFFDQPEASWDRWRDRLSLDARWREGRAAHSLNLFQEGRRDGQDRHMDFRAWFGGLDVYDEDDRRVALADFQDGGKRWWDGFNSGDERTTRFGMYPLRGD